MTFANALFIEASLRHAVFYKDKLQQLAEHYRADARVANEHLDAVLGQIQQAFQNLYTFAETQLDAATLLLDFVLADTDQIAVRLSPDDWQQWLDAATQVADANNNLFALCRLYIERCSIHFRRGDYAPAERNIQQALELAEELNHAYFLGRCHYVIALICQKQADPAAATDHVNLSRQYFERIGDTYEIGRVVSFIAQQAIDAFEYDTAERLLRENIILWQSLGNLRRTAIEQYQLGVMLTNTKRHDDAFSLLQDAKHAFEELGEKRYLAYVLLLLADINIGRSHHDEALAQVTKAKQLFQDSQDKRGAAAAWNKHGEVLYSMNALPEAIGCHQEALQIAQAIHYGYHTIEAFRRLGVIAAQQQKIEVAYQHFYDALARAQESHIKMQPYVVLEDVLGVFIAQEQWTDAATLCGFLAHKASVDHLPYNIAPQQHAVQANLDAQAYTTACQDGETLSFADFLRCLAR